MTSADPSLLSSALTELIALRGFARSRADLDLQEAWKTAAGEEWSHGTQPVRISRGVLTVEVRSSALLSELVAFHSPELTRKIQQQAPHLKVKSIKFKRK